MTNRTFAGILMLVLAAGLAACEGIGSRSPDAPATGQPQQTPRAPGTGPDTYHIEDVILIRLRTQP